MSPGNYRLAHKRYGVENRLILEARMFCSSERPNTLVTWCVHKLVEVRRHSLSSVIRSVILP
eukprot:758543-Hanusia_phi.AAC.4